MTAKSGSGGEIAVRKARRDELETLEGFPHASHYEHYMDFIRHALGTKECLVAEIDGELAGFVVWDRGFYARPFLWMLGVYERFRGRGAAGTLIAHVEGLNATRGLYTSTNESNLPMQRLLEKRGFTRTGVLDGLDPGDPEIFYFKPV